MKIDKSVYEFEWDIGNINKNIKHKVADKEAEEIFFDENKVVYKDLLHSNKEKRYILLGKTKSKRKRLLFIIFTKRKGKIRIISARDINKKEVFLYEKKS